MIGLTAKECTMPKYPPSLYRIAVRHPRTQNGFAWNYLTPHERRLRENLHKAQHQIYLLWLKDSKQRRDWPTEAMAQAKILEFNSVMPDFVFEVHERLPLVE
jgi:hypothetical protein